MFKKFLWWAISVPIFIVMIPFGVLEYLLKWTSVATDDLSNRCNSILLATLHLRDNTFPHPNFSERYNKQARQLKRLKHNLSLYDDSIEKTEDPLVVVSRFIDDECKTKQQERYNEYESRQQSTE